MLSNPTLSVQLANCFISRIFGRDGIEMSVAVVVLIKVRRVMKELRCFLKLKKWRRKEKKSERII
jgi:hypothetical protein